MQEKVQLTSSEIKIIEGKTPPQGVVDSISDYHRLRAEHEFLSTLKSYVQNLQDQKLEQSRQRPIGLKESFAPLPEEGSPEEVAKITTFNATQTSVKTEVLFLEKMLNFLKKCLPENKQDLDQLAEQLQKIAKVFPQLSEKQLESLPGMLGRMTEMSKQLSPDEQRTFWKMNLDMMQSLMQGNGESQSDLQDEMQELKNQLKMLVELTSFLTSIQQTLKSKPPKAKEWSQLVQNLQNLANAHPSLDPKQQAALETLFQQLSNFKDTKGDSLPQKLAEVVVHAKLSALLKTSPDASASQLKKALGQFLQESHLLNSPLPLMNQLGQSIQSLLNQPGFPESAGVTQLPFATNQEGTFTLNATFMESFTRGYAPDQKSLDAFEESSDKFDNAVHSSKGHKKARLSGYAEAHESLGAAQGAFAKGGLGASAGASSAGSLPNQFQKAILKHYMPGQERYLQALAMLLFLDNMGAEAGNALLTKILGFGQAADNYDFGGGLIPSDGQFSGNAQDAKDRLDAEKKRCQTDMDSAKQAIDKINEELAKIEQQLKNPNLTPEQRKILTDQAQSLKGFKANLDMAIKQLQSLKNLLDSLKIEKGSDDKHYKITSTDANWRSDLKTDEGNVINGQPDGKGGPQGGLVYIQAQIQAFQQKYSDQGQNQQMMLQMRMTEIQQEWTVVSTALQVLNQMYMSLAQGIYKG